MLNISSCPLALVNDMASVRANKQNIGHWSKYGEDRQFIL